jgi:deoxyribodipyrimidine photo-lyase
MVVASSDMNANRTGAADRHGPCARHLPSVTAVAVAVVLFTRDLRVHDNPALVDALEAADRVVPLFVVDDTILQGRFAAPNRTHLLVDALTDLRTSLQDRGGDLVVRRGDPANEVAAIVRTTGATTVHVAADVSGFAHRRAQRLQATAERAGAELVTHPGPPIVPPRTVLPTGGDHFKVFTPYWRAWERVRHRRAVLGAPDLVRLPNGVDPGTIPAVTELVAGAPSPELVRGGEHAARKRLDDWVTNGLERYDDLRDLCALDGTSALSPALHFGCLSATEVAARCDGRAGGEPFVRQLAWRDFHHQVTAAFPAIARTDYRPRGDLWDDDPTTFDAWAQGRTGYPIVDAAMRQLLATGWMHNRARMIAASFLVKDLHHDWRRGADHFAYWLADGDVAQNSANWQWIAGTGNDTRPNRVFNPLRQAERFDPAGAYVHRWVPELAGVAAPAVHRPWTLAAADRPTGYPARIVDHDVAAAAFLARRSGGGAGDHGGGDQQRLPI